MNRFFRVQLCAIALCTLAPLTITGQVFTITEINPTHPDGSAEFWDSGGRINRVALATDKIYYAASEFGGLFKSVDGGRTWARLDSHLPTEMFGVKVSPADPQRVIATSMFDGRVNTIAGINVSTDGGLTWIKPPSSHLPTSCDSLTVSTPSAFEIAFDEENPSRVFVGTSCGLARSADGGLTWTFVNPGPGALGTNVYGVTVHHGGIIDTCGSGGHRRSVDGGVTWTGASPGGRPLNAGQCSIVASPQEASVLFATVGINIFESDDGGGTWDTEFDNPSPTKGRLPFVNTNYRGHNQFDLWFGNVGLHRASCSTPPAGVSRPRCPPSSTWANNLLEGGHVDLGYITFMKPPLDDPACEEGCDEAKAVCDDDCEVAREDCLDNSGRHGGAQCQQAYQACTRRCKQRYVSCRGDCAARTARCPVLMGSDGGVYYNARRVEPACHTPQWVRPQVTPRALWLWTLSGLNIPNSLALEHLYFGTQDNGSFVSLDAGAAAPSWRSPDNLDIFDIVPDYTRALFTQCCFVDGTHVISRNPGLTGPAKDITNPSGIVPFGDFEDILARFGPNGYVIATTPSGMLVPQTSDVFVTMDITQNPIVWTKLGQTLAFVCGISVSGPADNPTFYAKVCYKLSQQAELYRYVGTSSTGTWQQILLPNSYPGTNEIGVFAVDPNNPNRLVVSQGLSVGDPTMPPIRMIRSDDGGASWTTMPALDTLMIGNGTYFISHSYQLFQPRLLAFDPHDANTIVAGAIDAGIFLTRDNGATWETITNNSGDANNPVIPWPHTAYFNSEGGWKNIFIGTKGRGAWRISYPDPRGPSGSSCQGAR